MANEMLFDGKAGDYARSRPGYAPAAVRFIIDELISAGGAVADVGAGTGILSREFIMRGIDTYCVEPNADMRGRAEAALGAEQCFHPIAASAEHTGLPCGSMALITVASAFHWFDAREFRDECERILEPDGHVCVLLNARDYSDPFTQRQHELCLRCCPGFRSLKHGLDTTEAAMADFFGADIHRAEFAFPLAYTRERFVSRSMSSSYAPGRDTPLGREYTTALNALIDEYDMGDEFTLPNKTVMFWGRLSSE